MLFSPKAGATVNPWLLSLCGKPDPLQSRFLISWRIRTTCLQPYQLCYGCQQELKATTRINNGISAEPSLESLVSAADRTSAGPNLRPPSCVPTACVYNFPLLDSRESSTWPAFRSVPDRVPASHLPWYSLAEVPPSIEVFICSGSPVTWPLCPQSHQLSRFFWRLWSVLFVMDSDLQYVDILVASNLSPPLLGPFLFLPFCVCCL